jgi:hypothetical protein
MENIVKAKYSKKLWLSWIISVLMIFTFILISILKSDNNKNIFWAFGIIVLISFCLPLMTIREIKFDDAIYVKYFIFRNKTFEYNQIEDYSFTRIKMANSKQGIALKNMLNKNEVIEVCKVYCEKNNKDMKLNTKIVQQEITTSKAVIISSLIATVIAIIIAFLGIIKTKLDSKIVGFIIWAITYTITYYIMRRLDKIKNNA